MQWRNDTTLPSRGLCLRPRGRSSECLRMTAGAESAKAQNEHMFSGLSPKARRMGKGAQVHISSAPMLACGAVPMRLDASRAASAWAWRAYADDRGLGGITELRAFAHPTRRGSERHGHADAGLELARAKHSPGRRRARNRAEGAAAAGAELDLDQARDASAAGALGAALFDARRGLARIRRCGALASRLDARRLRRIPGFSPD